MAAAVAVAELEPEAGMMLGVAGMASGVPGGEPVRGLVFFVRGPVAVAVHAVAVADASAAVGAD